MRRLRPRSREARLGTTLLVTVLAGCASPHAGNGARAASTPPSGLAGTVLHSGDLQAFLTLAEALKGRVPSLRIRSGGACPVLTLRNAREPGPFSSPLIYIDGTRTAGTCPLVDLPTHEVERVEVYPLGVTTRPGYARSANGLILVFLKRG